MFATVTFTEGCRSGRSAAISAQFRIVLIAIVFSAIALGAARGEVIAEHRGAYIKSKAITESFPFEIVDATREYGISATAILDAGSGSLRVLDPNGEMVYQHLWSTRQSQKRSRLPVAASGTYTLEVTVENARGEWRARVVALPARASLRWMYLSAALLVVLPVVALVIAQVRGAAFRYAAAGGLMFLIGRVVWFAGAIVLKIAAGYALEDAMPFQAFLWIQSLILGVWEGIAATLAVVTVAVLVRTLRDKPANAIAAGIGAGALEMALTGVISILGLAIMFGGGQKSDGAQFLQAYDMAVTPALVLADPAIYAVRTVCTVAATVLIAYGLRARRFGPVCGGFVLFGSVLTAVGASRTLALFGPESRWLQLGVTLPVAIVSAVVLWRNLAAWLDGPKGEETAMDAFLREHEAAEK